MLGTSSEGSGEQQGVSEVPTLSPTQVHLLGVAPLHHWFFSSIFLVLEPRAWVPYATTTYPSPR